MNDVHKDLKADFVIANPPFNDSDWKGDGIEDFKVTLSNGSEAYLYANKCYFIPFNWWANPVPSTASSAWVILIDTGFNPFLLGGGPDYGKVVFYGGFWAFCLRP